MSEARHKKTSVYLYKRWIRITSMVLILAFSVQEIAQANPDLLSIRKETLAPETLLAGSNKAEAFQKIAAAYINRVLLSDNGVARAATLCTIEAMVPDLISQAKDNGLAEEDMPRIIGGALEGAIRIVFPNGNAILFYNPKVRRDIRGRVHVEINEYLREMTITEEAGGVTPADAAPEDEFKKPAKPARSYKTQLSRLAKLDGDVRRMTGDLLGSISNNWQLGRLNSRVMTASRWELRQGLNAGRVERSLLESLISSVRITSRWSRLSRTQRNALDSVSERARKIIEKKDAIAVQLGNMEAGLWKPYELTRHSTPAEKQEYLELKTTELAVKLESVIEELDERKVNLRERLLALSGVMRAWLKEGGNFPRDEIARSATAMHSMSRMGREEGKGVIDYVDKTRVDRIGNLTRAKLFYLAESMYSLVEASRIGEGMEQAEFDFGQADEEGAPMGMVGWIWRPMIRRGWMKRETAALVSALFEELFFSMMMLNILPAFIGARIEFAAAHMAVLYLVSAFTYGFSHNYLFRWENSKELDFMPRDVSWHEGDDHIFPDEKATFADKLGFTALGALFRSVYLIPGAGVATGFMVALTAHVLYNRFIARKLNLPLGMSSVHA